MTHQLILTAAAAASLGIIGGAAIVLAVAYKIGGRAAAPTCVICGGAIDLSGEWVEVVHDRPMHVACYELATGVSTSTPSTPPQLDGAVQPPLPFDQDADRAAGYQLDDSEQPGRFGPLLVTPERASRMIGTMLGSPADLHAFVESDHGANSPDVDVVEVWISGTAAVDLFADELRDLDVLDLATAWSTGEVVELPTAPGALCFPPSAADVLVGF